MIKYYFFLAIGMISSLSFGQENLQEIIIIYKNGAEAKGILPEERVSDYQVIELEINGVTTAIQPREILQMFNPATGYLIKPYTHNGSSYFMESLVLGEANLFFLRDQQGKPRYIAQLEDEHYQELSSDKTSSRIEGRNYSRNTNTYLGILKILFSDCPPEGLNETRITFKSLTNAFSEYNRCRNNLTYREDTAKATNEFRLSLLAGASFNKVSPTTSNLADNFGTDAGLNAGVEMAYLFSKMSIALGVFYAEKGGIGNYTLRNYEKAIFNYKFLELGLSARYNMLGKEARLQPYIGITVNQGLVLNKDRAALKATSGGEEVDFYTGTLSEPKTAIPITVSYEAGLNYSLHQKGGLVFKGIYYNHEDGVDRFQFSGITALTGYYFRF